MVKEHIEDKAPDLGDHHIILFESWDIMKSELSIPSTLPPKLKLWEVHFLRFMLHVFQWRVELYFFFFFKTKKSGSKELKEYGAVSLAGSFYRKPCKEAKKVTRKLLPDTQLAFIKGNPQS